MERLGGEILKIIQQQWKRTHPRLLDKFLGSNWLPGLPFDKVLVQQITSISQLHLSILFQWYLISIISNSFSSKNMNMLYIITYIYIYVYCNSSPLGVKIQPVKRPGANVLRARTRPRVNPVEIDTLRSRSDFGKAGISYRLLGRCWKASYNPFSP